MGTLRKILTTGVGAALMTEGGIRNAISDIKVTRQAKAYIARQTQKGREEFAKVLAGEIKRFLNHIDLHEEIRELLSGLTIEVEARVKLLPSGREDQKPVTVRKLGFKKVSK